MKPIRQQIAWVAAALCIPGLIIAVGRADDAPRKPTFEYSRPKGPKQVVAPLPKEPPIPPTIRFGNFKPFNEIDNFILATLQERKARPKPVCNDWDFLRRSSLDLVGVIPTAADVEKFLAWDAKTRRAKWIDHLLDQAQYADYWTSFWGDLLRERGRIRGVPVNAFKNYIHDNLKKNRPYDEWVREMITAEGRPEDSPAAAFFLRDEGDAKTLTVTVTQTFLGIQLKCAECHDHPFDWWLEKDFHGMVDFWRGTRRQAYERDTVVRRGRTQMVPRFEVVTNERRANGTFITGETSDKGRGREALADLLTRPDNPYFARVAVNRLWEKLMGVGLVNPVDNFSARNPPSHPELLDWLALEFIEHNYDLKHILKLIANSRTYQQTSVENLTRTKVIKAPDTEDETEAGALFDGMMLRRMSAEQVHDSILVATGRYLPEDRRFTPSIEVTYPPDPRSFLRVFGVTDRETLIERNETGSIQQALTLLNGQLINEAVKMHPAHPVRHWQKDRQFSAVQMVDAIFVQILTRPPTPEERELALAFIAGGQRDTLWEDLQWSLLNCREFQFIR